MIDAIAEPTYRTGIYTSAHRLADQNWRSNLRALSKTQAEILDIDDAIPSGVEWVFGRDGALTALLPGGGWWAGNSLPERAARFMLAKSDVSATVICFLHPTHAAQLRTALDRMQANQALLAIVPDAATLKMILGCDDFAPAIAAHRLFIVAGDQWETQLDSLLERQLGLPMPTQFIRPILADLSPADALIVPAQKIFGEHSARRTKQTQTLCEQWMSRGLRKICVVAPNVFRLWDDAGPALLQATASFVEAPSADAASASGCRSASTKADPAHNFGKIEIRIFNPDDPASASPAALTSLATTCDALLMPNTGRGDLPDVIPDEMPLVSWVTTPRIPSVEKAGLRDALLLCDPDWIAIAIEQGWQPTRVFVAGWPSTSVIANAPAQSLAIISDTHPLDPPERITEYSSHRLLWEAIAHELLEDPFSLAGAADDYLSDRMRQARVEEEGLDRSTFLTGVIWNAYQQGIARLLIGEKLPVDLFGNGWERFPEFAPYSRGPVQSREQLATIVTSAQALVHAWPTFHAHPMEATGKPIVRFTGDRNAFIRDARQTLAGKIIAARPAIESLSAAKVLQALSAVDVRIQL